MNIQDLISALSEQGIACKTEYDLRNHVSFRLACTAALVICPNTVEELALAATLCREMGVPTVLLGRGSNLFFAGDRYEGAVVLTDACATLTREGDCLVATCGVSLLSLCLHAAELGLSGLEFAYGIPGSVGGAVYMNAGAYGGAISDVLCESTAYDLSSGEVVVLCEHDFGYRKSIYMENPNLICLSARFSLRQSDRARIEKTMRGHMQSRREKQPLEYPSAGSYFKRPEGHFAGKLIEDCGLKGLRVGGAEVSEKHAGFLVNRGGATAADVLALEKKVTDAVLERFGVRLEREVRVVE